jgi:hypothetical protein
MPSDQRVWRQIEQFGEAKSGSKKIRLYTERHFVCRIEEGDHRFEFLRHGPHPRLWSASVLCGVAIAGLNDQSWRGRGAAART